MFLQGEESVDGQDIHTGPEGKGNVISHWHADWTDLISRDRLADRPEGRQV